MAQGYLGVQGSGCSHPAVHPSSRKEATRPRSAGAAPAREPGLLLSGVVAS